MGVNHVNFSQYPQIFTINLDYQLCLKNMVPTACFSKGSFIGTQPWSLVYILSFSLIQLK